MTTLTVRRIPRPATAKQSVRKALHSAILQGDIESDAVLTEGSLAEALGVSRTPVREVLQELELQGLLEPAGARGKRIRRIERAEVHEILWLRRVLEGAIVAKLARRGIPNDVLETVNHLLSEQRLAAEKKDGGRFLRRDAQFHVELARATGWPRVTAIIVNLRQIFQLVGLRAISYPRRFEQVIAEHERIIQAISAGDAKIARRAMAAHLLNTERLAMRHIRAA